MSGALSVRLAAELFSTFRAPRLSENELRVLAQRRLRRVLAAAARTPLYAQRSALACSRAENPFTALARLPTVCKDDLREAGDAAFVGGRVDPRWYASTSSGSTGEPFTVRYDARAWAILKYLVKLRSRAACGLRPWHRVALLEAVPTDAEQRGPLVRLGRVRQLSVLRPTEEIARMLDTFRPDVIHGLPSALLEVAMSLRPSSGGLRPKAVFTGGELLQDCTRRELRQRFGCRIFDVYGTSETKEIAWECAHGGLHINADVVHVEALDVEGRPLPAGEEGDLVVTSLVNRAMPLLRYRTGDRGSLREGRCRCGLALPLLGVVTGRESDALELAGGRRVSPYALTVALEHVHGVRQYRIVQRGPSQLEVQVSLGADSDHSWVAQQVRRALGEALPVDRVTIDVRCCDRLEASPGGKRRVVEPFRGEPSGVHLANAGSTAANGGPTAEPHIRGGRPRPTPADP